MFWKTCLASILVALFELMLAGAVSILGVVIASPGALHNLPIVARMANRYPAIAVVMADQASLLTHILSLLVMAIFFKMLANILATWRQALLSQQICKEIGSQIFDGYMHASYLWHVSQDLPRMTAHLNWRSHLATFMQGVLLALTQLAVGIFLFGSVFIAAPVVGLIVLSVTGLCAMLSYSYFRKVVRCLSQTISTEEVKLQKVVLPSLQGIREVIIYRQQAAFSRMFDEISEKTSTLRVQLAVANPITPWVMELVGMSMLLASVWYMNSMGTSLGRLTGTLALLAAVAWRLMPALNKFVNALLQMQQTLPYIAHVFERLSQVAEFASPEKHGKEECRFDADIRFDKVSFRYPATAPDRPDSLSGVNLDIRKGSMVGFVGVSGAGKSTLVGLLTGLFPPVSGAILIDSKPLDDARRANWTNKIGYVPQSPFLLNASIAENIAFSKWGQVLNEKLVLECCRMAAIDFIDDLPQGVHTIIGERGVRLSGGQVQRVSIARALYDKPQLIVFDEATSALDGAAEQSIQHTINSLRQHMTLIIVAHRLSTVENCDTVYWIADGTIAKSGRPEDVLPSYQQYLQERTQDMVGQINGINGSSRSN